MKKIIISILALACGVCAYAKTLDEMLAEIPAYQNDASTRAARLAYMEENKADILREFDAWKVKDIAKFYPNAAANKSLTEAQRIEADKLRAFFCGFYWIYGAELDVPDNTAIRMAIGQFCKLGGAEKYAKIKADGFKLDGVDISAGSRLILAAYNNDVEYIFANAALLDQLDKGGLSYLVPFLKKILLSASDLDKAKAFCNAYERAMLLKNCSDTEAIKNINKYLTERILDAKIVK